MRELLFESVRIVDGTGAQAVPGDVLVRGNQIAEVGSFEAPRDAVRIAGRDRVLCPGFIDVHAHDDMALLYEPELVSKLSQGVTTVVVGNCGIGLAPMSATLKQALKGSYRAILGPGPMPYWETFSQYIAIQDATPISVNVAFLASHASVRMAVLGSDARTADKRELALMRDVVAACMDAGALGLSTGLVYEPSRFANAAELAELATEVGRFGGVYASHIRDEGENLLEAIAEAIAVGESSGVPVQISHLKAVGRGNWGKLQNCLRLIREARDRGTRVGVDLYPYTAAATALGPAVEIHGTGKDSRGSGIQLVYAPELEELEGRYLAAIATQWGMDEAEAARRILERSETVMAVMHVMSEDGVRDVLKFEGTMIGSDGLPNPSGRTHPRTFGTFTRVLARYVREQGVLGLEEAVHRMTGLPAAAFGLRGRGRVAPGMSADLVLFDPAVVEDRATFNSPNLLSAGIDVVVVNGEPVLQDGIPLGRYPGQLLLRGAA